MAGDLVVGYDGSECAKVALVEAALVANRMNVDLAIVFASEPPAVYGGGAADQRRVLEERGRELLDEALDLLKESPVTCTTHIIDNKPPQALVGLAEQVDASMIVVGTYSERPLAAALVGSTPHKLLHLSNHPVLVVPVPD
jgi:nucleotide-binding universal stress UspA family protein